MTDDELGLFPLGIVLLPGEQIPLHVFEPRYRELIGQCLDTGEPFGLLLADARGMREVGTRASVTEVLEQFDDGRLNVAVEGGDRFRLVELTSGRSFYTARVEDLGDDEDPADPTDAERVRELFRELQSVAGTDLDEPEDDAEPLSFAVASLLDFGIEPKQELLELRSERVRLKRLVKLLENGITQLRAARERADVASRNGRPRRG